MSPWSLEQFTSIGIEIVIFDSVLDFMKLSMIAVGLSILLASMIVLGHKEEV